MAPKRKTPVSVVLVGIMGMGQSYLETLMGGFPSREVHIKAVVEPFPEQSAYRNELRDRGIPVLDSLAAVYENCGSSDLVVVCSPIHCHVEQTSLALEHGSHVLCEKPIALTVAEAHSLVEAGGKHPHLKLMEACMYRHHPQRVLAKRLADEGKIRELRTIQTLCPYYLDAPTNVRNRPARGGGWLMGGGG